jgi:hypothetical protein
LKTEGIASSNLPLRRLANFLVSRDEETILVIIALVKILLAGINFCTHIRRKNSVFLFETSAAQYERAKFGFISIYSLLT